jgi:hypothetical protein
MRSEREMMELIVDTAGVIGWVTATLMLFLPRFIAARLGALAEG